MKHCAREREVLASRGRRPRSWGPGLVRLGIAGVVLSGLAGASIGVGGGGMPRPAVEAGGGESRPAEVAAAAVAIDGSALYRQHCAGCHGDRGDGQGQAARFLYPRPRNFRGDRFRFVTTTNFVPSDADLDRVLTHGLPGSAMFPFGHLSQEERKALVDVVKAFVHDGVVDQVKKEAEEFGEDVDPDELASVLKNRLEAGPRIEVPALPGANEASVARGRELYVKTCATCHGDTGKGDGAQEQKDDFGAPIRPRDFTRGTFKGGRDRDQLYARIVLGVPGTPMPAAPQLKPGEVGDMIDYILSLSDPSAGAKVEHRRTRIVARKLPAPLGEPITDAAWLGEATPIVISPLWWRDGGEPDFRVQAVHDGREIAIRLSWRDATRSESVIRPQDFADMAAVELFGGDRSAEPFLGMGDHGGAVDLWLWNAAGQADQKHYQDMDSAYPNMVVDMYPFEKAGEAGQPHRADRQSRDFLSALAVGNPRSDPTRPLSGSNLQAEGSGSTTFRPRTSQVVKAAGQWQDGGWSVVLRRPLIVDASAGTSIPPGSRRSVAFAVWEGSAGDRNGQKLVSIWHDLELE